MNICWKKIIFLLGPVTGVKELCTIYHHSAGWAANFPAFLMQNTAGTEMRSRRAERLNVFLGEISRLVSNLSPICQGIVRAGSPAGHMTVSGDLLLVTLFKARENRCSSVVPSNSTPPFSCVLGTVPHAKGGFVNFSQMTEFVLFHLNSFSSGFVFWPHTDTSPVLVRY